MAAVDLIIADESIDDVDAKVKAARTAVENVSLAAAGIKQCVSVVEGLPATSGLGGQVASILGKLADTLSKVEPAFDNPRQVLETQLTSIQEHRAYAERGGLEEELNNLD